MPRTTPTAGLAAASLAATDEGCVATAEVDGVLSVYRLCAGNAEAAVLLGRVACVGVPYTYTSPIYFFNVRCNR